MEKVKSGKGKKRKEEERNVTQRKRLEFIWWGEDNLFFFSLFDSKKGQK